MTHLEYTDRQCSSLCLAHFHYTPSLHIWALGLHTLDLANVHTLNCIQTRKTTWTSHHPLHANTDIHKPPLLLTQTRLILVQFSKHFLCFSKFKPVYSIQISLIPCFFLSQLTNDQFININSLIIQDVNYEAPSALFHPIHYKITSAKSAYTFRSII